MGEPAPPTPAERAATLELARAIVSDSLEDIDPPPPFTHAPEDAATAAFRLAQDLVDLNERHDRLVAAVLEFRDRDRLNYRCPFAKPCGDCPSCRIERVGRIAEGVE
jgi:hypothetical protein